MGFEQTYRNSRKLFTFFTILCITLLSACTPIVQSPESGTTIAVATATPEAAATEQTTQADLDCEAGYHAYTHEFITVPACIPDAPQKIITLEPYYTLQMAVQLDLPVIATGGYGDGEERFPTALTLEETKDITFVGASETPNLEEIAQLAPDLIIGDAYFQSERYELLREIAPTILINTANWKTWLTILGEVGGVPEQASAALAEYDARVATILEQLIDGHVSFVRIVPDGFQLYRAAPDAYAPIAIMTEVGITRPEFEVGTNENSWERLDWEGVLNLTGDVLFYAITGDEEAAQQLETEVTSNPLWQQLPAVKAGQAYRVNAEQWMSFGGLRSAHAVLDDIERYLTTR